MGVHCTARTWVTKCLVREVRVSFYGTPFQYLDSSTAHLPKLIKGKVHAFRSSCPGRLYRLVHSLGLLSRLYLIVTVSTSSSA